LVICFPPLTLLHTLSWKRILFEFSSHSPFHPGMVKDSQFTKKMKSCQGPVLKCRDSRKRRAFYVNELVIHEIRNNTPSIFQNFFFSCCKMEFVQCGKNPLKPLPSLCGYPDKCRSPVRFTRSFPFCQGFGLGNNNP
jgi:hypothetical protein